MAFCLIVFFNWKGCVVYDIRFKEMSKYEYNDTLSNCQNIFYFVPNNMIVFFKVKKDLFEYAVSHPSKTFKN